MARATNDRIDMNHSPLHLCAPMTSQMSSKACPGLVVWFTGLSGAGKTTLATSVERSLANVGLAAFVLDGDSLRTELCRDLGFTASDRAENVRRIGVVAQLMADAGLICLVALISPFSGDRLMARRRLPTGSFIEVFVNAPLSICEERDTKGLYQLARAGRIPEFTGISSPYEAPEAPELEVRTDLLDIDESTEMVLNILQKRMRFRRSLLRKDLPMDG
jgi:adenylyl-sulfate kinase